MAQTKVLVLGNPEKDTLGFHVNFHTNKIKGFQSEIYDYYLYESALLRSLVRKSDLFKKINLRFAHSKIEKYKPEIIISVYKNVDPRIIYYANQKNICTIHLNPDHLGTLGNQETIVCEYDYYFCKSDYSKKILEQKLNFNAFKFFEAYSPILHKSKYDSKLEAENDVLIDLLAYGTMYPYRMSIINDLGLNTKIFGSQHNLTHAFNDINGCEIIPRRYLRLADKANTLLGSKVVFNNLYYLEYDSLNNKFFENLGIGAVQVVDEKPDVYKVLKKNVAKHITFETITEAREKIVKILKNRDLRFYIHDEFKKVRGKYTYFKLLDYIYSTTGFN